VQTYTITKGVKEKELNIIKDTIHNNEYNINLGTRHPRKPHGPLSHTAVNKEIKLQTL
jgi:hypothetical protein